MPLRLYCTCTSPDTPSISGSKILSMSAGGSLVSYTASVTVSVSVRFVDSAEIVAELPGLVA